jgi:hypothetical protein
MESRKYSRSMKMKHGIKIRAPRSKAFLAMSSSFPLFRLETTGRHEEWPDPQRGQKPWTKDVKEVFVCGKMAIVARASGHIWPEGEREMAKCDSSTGDDQKTSEIVDPLLGS